MKTIFVVIVSILISVASFGQRTVSISSAEYAELKHLGLLDSDAQYVFSDTNVRSDASGARMPIQVTPQAATCNCMVPLDTTFQVVPFGLGTAPDYRNDDGSALIVIPFQFDFFGIMYDTIYINNNGNISVGNPFGTFTASPFPSTQYSMIAPFWADVDTRDLTSGLVYYKITPTHLIVRWDSVGYYAQHADKLNTFQLIITDGIDTILPPGNNVSFCYGDMQWTTGDASQGINGFGGSPSTSGVNQGNGLDYFQVTQSNDSTSVFDGPYNNADGVSWLDEMEITFNTALTGNVPPLVMNNTICDTIDVYTGDTIRISAIDSIVFEFYSLTPEIGQTITTTITTNAPAGALTYVQTISANNTNAFQCIFDARNIPPGFYTITATATDNGSPAMQSSSSVYIQTIYDSALSVGELHSTDVLKIYPNPIQSTLNIEHGSDVREIVICTVGGTVINKTATSGTQTLIETESLSPGIYFLQVINSDGSVVVDRFVKY